MKDPVIKISIILVSYNTAELTVNAISSIYEKTNGVVYEIILVDNLSKDNTLSLVRHNFPNVICIENNKNSGFGSANNIGVKVARGEYVFLLNTDTVLMNNAIKILSDYLDQNIDNNVAAVCGNLYDLNNRPATSYSKLFPSIFLELNTLCFNFLHKIKLVNFCFNYSNRPIHFRGSLSGADCMLVKRHFEDVNGFDENFFLYYEETDLFYRLIKNGYLVASVPQAKIIHLEGASESIQEKTLIRSFTSKFIYLKKHKSKYEYYHYLYQCTVLSRMFFFRMLGKKEKYEYWNLLKTTESRMYSESKK